MFEKAHTGILFGELLAWLLALTLTVNGLLDRETAGTRESTLVDGGG